MDEVEFRHHVVGDANAGDPAVLYAIQGPAWFISRALVVGNRGGDALDGAVVRVVGGGRAIFDNSTFDDNTFRNGISYGHTIGVYNNSATPAILWLFHVTMRRALSLDETTVGSLLTVRGPTTDVRVDNTALLGTCGFGGGGAILQGVGNAEAADDTCGLDHATNFVNMDPSQMALGNLDDFGGFTRSFYPSSRISNLVDAADAAFCTAVRRARPAAVCASRGRRRLRHRSDRSERGRGFDLRRRLRGLTQGACAISRRRRGNRARPAASPCVPTASAPSSRKKFGE